MLDITEMLMDQVKQSQSASGGASSFGASTQTAFDSDLSASIFSNTFDMVNQYNKTLQERNEQEKSTSQIHGMSDAEYEEYVKKMAEYGIDVNDYWSGNIAEETAKAAQSGVRFNEVSKIATSYDSVLDLVLDEKLQIAIEEIYGDRVPDWDSLVRAGQPGGKLYERGIAVTQDHHKMYSFALIDENGEIIQDEEGHLAQHYAYGNLLPDGQAQKNELFVAGLLDQMGFDCLSALDLTKEEYEMVKKMSELDNSQLGNGSGIGGTSSGAIKEKVLGANNSKVKAQDNSYWMNEGLRNARHTAGYWSNKWQKIDSGYQKTGGRSLPIIEALRNAKGSGSSKASNSGSYDMNNINSKTNSNETNSSSKTQVTLSEFDRIVEKIATQRRCEKIEAVEIAAKDYDVKGIVGIKSYYENKLKAQTEEQNETVEA